jgi:HSP20 family molecular chaperone IbpA
MSDDERERPGPIAIDALNEMGRRLLNVLGSVEQTFRRDQTSRTHGFTIKTPRGRLAGNAGLTIRHGLTPEQPERAQGRRQPAAAQPRIDGTDGQLVDVFDEPAEILVTIAPCAFAVHELSIRVERAELRIEAIGGRRFRQLVPLPRDPGEAVPTARLSNGILEIRIPKPKPTSTSTSTPTVPPPTK